MCFRELRTVVFFLRRFLDFRFTGNSFATLRRDLSR
jgi:hypothetical protein